MINELRESVVRNWSCLKQDDGCNVDELSFTKFCQRIVCENTKVLFLVTYKGNPLCIIKVMRNIRFNEKLKNEARAQKTIFSLNMSAVPRVYFEDMVGNLFIYGEEVISGLPISRRLALKKEREIIEIVKSFPVDGEISSRITAKVFDAHFHEKDDRIRRLIEHLYKSDVVLKKGLTHSDLGRPNILSHNSGVRFIDWERARERPFWLIDAVYFMVRLHKIRNIKEWNGKAAPILMRHTGITAEVAESLYVTLMLFEKSYRKYPEAYKKIISDFAVQ